LPSGRVMLKRERITVLLVDDDEDDYVIVNDLLSSVKKTRFEVHWATNPEEAFHKASKTDFDVCLLDYRLGKSDGLQILRELRQIYPDIPVIFLTGHGNYNLDMEAMRQGASDYLEKGSFGATFLERCIRYAIDRSRNLRALRESKQKLHDLSRKLIEAQEKERKLLARELHDSLGSSLTAIRYALEQKLRTMDRNQEAPEGISLEQIIEMVEETIEESQRISANLRPSVLDDLGLIPALRSLGREFEAACSHIRTETRLEAREEDIPEPLKIVIYRIAQEALNNASKHSGADNTLLKLGKTEKGIELLIKDNGRGFDCEGNAFDVSSGSGMGLEGMKERATLANGSLEMWSEKRKGTVIQAWWPLVQQ